MTVTVDVKMYDRQLFTTIANLNRPKSISILSDSSAEESKVDERDLALALRLIKLRDIESNPGPLLALDFGDFICIEIVSH